MSPTGKITVELRVTPELRELVEELPARVDRLRGRQAEMDACVQALANRVGTLEGRLVDIGADIKRVGATFPDPPPMSADPPGRCRMVEVGAGPELKTGGPFDFHAWRRDNRSWEICIWQAAEIWSTSKDSRRKAEAVVRFTELLEKLWEAAQGRE